MQHFTPNLEKISAATRLFLHLMPERHGQTDGRTWDTKVGYLLTGFFSESLMTVLHRACLTSKKCCVHAHT